MNKVVSKFNLTREEVNELLEKTPSMFNCALLLDLKRMYNLFDYTLSMIENDHGIKIKIDGINN